MQIEQDEQATDQALWRARDELGCLRFSQTPIPEKYKTKKETMIFKLDEHPVKIWFHEGLRKAEEVGAFDGGIEFKHRINGDQVQQILYLPERAHKQLIATAQGEDCPTVELAQKGRGNGKKWSMKRIEAQTDTPVTQPQTRAASQLDREVAAERAAAERAAAERAKPSPAAGPVAVAAPQQRPAAADNPRPEARVLAAAMMTAIDALRATADYAESRDMPFDFEINDVRTLGITLYIEHCKQRAAQGSERRSA